MRWPLKAVFITQKWGENPDTYKRFGIVAHNGIDLRAPAGTEVYAPHDGIVKERKFDKDGYGNYLKIESDREGSILAHLERFEVHINKAVKEGDLVGYADNTGFSTGSHLHFGYYRIPRNRNDGYLGYINQESLINQTPDEELKECLRLLHDVVIPEKEGLQREYQEFRQKTAEEIKSRDDKIAEMEQKVKAAETDRDQYKRLFDNFKDEDYQKIQSLSQKLLSRGDWPGIIAEIDRLLTVEDQKRGVEKELSVAKEGVKEYWNRVEELERRVSTVKSEVVPNSTSSSGSGKKKGGAWIWQKLLKALNWITQVLKSQSKSH